MRRWTTGLLAGLLFALPGCAPAPAGPVCGCAGGTTTDFLARADAVFAGRPVERAVADDTAVHVFAVDTVYAGDVAARQGVVSAASGASCGLELAGDGPFLVFARLEDDRLAADLCGGTAPWTAGTAAEVQLLTGAAAPEPGEAGTGLPGGPSDAVLEVAVAVLLVGAVAGGLLLRRRGARS